MKKYTRALEQITKLAEMEIQKLADDYRKAVLIPACKRAKMRYISGNGTWYFLPLVVDKNDPDLHISYGFQAKDQKKNYLIPVIKMLDEIVLDSDMKCFGFYMTDVNESDIK
jgi:hypothetical protein